MQTNMLYVTLWFLPLDIEAVLRLHLQAEDVVYPLSDPSHCFHPFSDNPPYLANTAEN